MDGVDYEKKGWPMPAILGIWGDQVLSIVTEIGQAWCLADVAELEAIMADLATWIPSSPVPNILAFLYEYATAGRDWAALAPGKGVPTDADAYRIIADVAQAEYERSGSEPYKRVADEAREKEAAWNARRAELTPADRA